MVRAVIVSVEDDPVAGEQRRQVPVRRPDEALVEVAARHARLVGDDHQRKARVAKPGERAGDTGKRRNQIQPIQVAALRSACRRDPGTPPVSCGRPAAPPRPSRSRSASVTRSARCSACSGDRSGTARSMHGRHHPSPATMARRACPGCGSGDVRCSLVGPKIAGNGHADRGGEVHRARVVRDHRRRARENARQRAQVGFSRQVDHRAVGGPARRPDTRPALHRPCRDRPRHRRARG